MDLPALTEAMRATGFGFHFAANADVRFGTEHPRKDLEQNTIATFHVLEGMRANGIKRIAFSSTGSVYGEHDHNPSLKQTRNTLGNFLLRFFYRVLFSMLAIAFIGVGKSSALSYSVLLYLVAVGPSLLLGAFFT